MHPAKETKLVLEVLALQAADKGHEAKDVEHKGEEAMVPSKWDEVGIDKDNVLKVVDQRLPVEEVVAHGKEIPGL